MYWWLTGLRESWCYRWGWCKLRIVYYCHQVYGQGGTHYCFREYAKKITLFKSGSLTEVRTETNHLKKRSYGIENGSQKCWWLRSYWYRKIWSRRTFWIIDSWRAGRQGEKGPLILSVFRTIIYYVICGVVLVMRATILEKLQPAMNLCA